jgi:hypothetical protein
MKSTAPPLKPFVVGEVVATSLEALLSAAALHLGEAMPDGRKLAKTDPQEAWRALMAATGMLRYVGPLMDKAIADGYQATLQKRLALLAARHPNVEFPIPPDLDLG